MKLLWRSGRRRGKADGKEKEKDIRQETVVGDNGTESKYRGSAVFSNVCAGSADSKKGGECRCVGITA